MAIGQDFLSRGSLKIQFIKIRNNFPIQNAKVSISSKGEPERVLEQLTTDSSGQTENISLPARLRGKVTLSLWEFAKSVSEKFKLACGSDSEFF